MKKRITLIILALVCMLVLSACGCAHETWNEADCVNPRTCAECGETEGAPLGHTWAAATCETAKTCETCGEAEGEALGHSWVEADCETARTCANCNLTEGEALGHAWQEATTELPKTCATCAATEGERIITDVRFTTEATAEIQGKWSCEVPMTGEMMGVENFEGQLNCRLIMEMGNDGTLTMSFEAANEEEFSQAMITYLVDTMYAEFEASGIDKEAADAAMQDIYGMSVEEYCAETVKGMDVSGIFDSMNFSAKYYVEDGHFYIGLSWEAEMEPTPYTLEGDSLTLEGDIGAGTESTVFTRVTE